MKKLFLGILSVFFISAVWAQAEKSEKKSRRDARAERINAMARMEEEGVIGYKKHTIYGAKLTSDGYGGFIEIGRARSVRKALLFQLDIAERKHVKEEKQQIYSNTSPIIYGKINFFYPVKLGVQYQYLLGNKGNKNGISITGNLGGGLSLGLLRPYLIDLDKQGERTYVKYESADSSYFLDQSVHIAGPGFGRGWSDLKVTPGLYLKPAIRFDYGKYNEMVSALEVGLTAEYYTKKIPQMIYIEQKKLFFSAYVSILFGRRK
jgi:hypothetical protein